MRSAYGAVLGLALAASGCTVPTIPCTSAPYDIAPFSRLTIHVAMVDVGQVALVASDGRVVVPRGAGASAEARINARATAGRDETGAIVVGRDEIADASKRHQVVVTTDALLEFEFPGPAERAGARAAVGWPDAKKGTDYDLPVELSFSVSSTRLGGTVYAQRMTVPCRHEDGLCVHLVTPRSNLLEVREVLTYDRYVPYRFVGYCGAPPGPDRDVVLIRGAS